jgi:hypothetical protein
VFGSSLSVPVQEDVLSVVCTVLTAAGADAKTC